MTFSIVLMNVFENCLFEPVELELLSPLRLLLLPLINKNCLSNIVGFFVYIINTIIHGCLEIQNFSSRVNSIFHSFATLEEKFHIPARPCIIVYFILWNNKEITIENKSILWAHLSEQGICFVRDLLDKNGKFLSLENVQRKYNVHLNFFQYFQLIAAIPSYLKKYAQETAVTSRKILNERDVFYLSENKALYLTKLHEVQRLLQFISGKQYERTYRCEKLDQTFSQLCS